VSSCGSQPGERDTGPLTSRIGSHPESLQAPRQGRSQPKTLVLAWCLLAAALQVTMGGQSSEWGLRLVADFINFMALGNRRQSQRCGFPLWKASARTRQDG
jgi:hypothetical protein